MVFLFPPLCCLTCYICCIYIYIPLGPLDKGQGLWPQSRLSFLRIQLTTLKTCSLQLHQPQDGVHPSLKSVIAHTVPSVSGMSPFPLLSLFRFFPPPPVSTRFYPLQVQFMKHIMKTSMTWNQGTLPQKEKR